MNPILEIRHLSKQYKLGVHRGPKTDNLRELLQRQFASSLDALRGKNAGENANSGTQAFWALKDVCFDVNHGEVVGIIGRNGAGKSTLLKILSRITTPSEGEVIARGRLASLLEVGTGFHPELTGRENIYLNGAILGMRKSEINRRFDEIVAFSEIEQFLDTPVKHYSSGMYVRLAFAVAAHLNPEILIVDEVLAVGDLAFQKKCLGKMGEVSRGGRTVLFVSHNMAAVENLCSRAIVLHRGKLQYDGVSKDAIEYYLKSVSTQGGTGNVIELEGVGRRRTEGPPLMKRLELLTNHDEPLNEGIPIGGMLKVKIYFDLHNPSDSVHVGMGFDNVYGQRILTAHSIFEPEQSFTTHVGPRVYTCEIPSFTVTPGDYTIKVWVDLKGVQVDVIEDAAKVTVLESDYYGTGRAPWNGAVVMPHRWRLEEVQTESSLAVGRVGS